ncbi:MAG: hypothetical protein ACHQC8_02415 [Solirubrobacterales bacterium]
MIEIHLKDGRTLTGELPGKDIRFVNGENGTFVVERRVGDAAGEWQTIAICGNDAFGFAYDKEQLTLSGATNAGD